MATLGNFNAYVPSPWTSGAGIVIGTNCDFGGILMGAAATTVTLVTPTGTICSISGGSIYFCCGTTGAVTGTSSGGSFSVLYRNRLS